MPLSSSEREIVIFIGAGFSHDAALPTMAEFGNVSRNDNKDLWKHASARRDSGDFRYAAPMLVESAEVFRQFQQFCKQSPTLRDSEVENVETVFCIAEAMYESLYESDSKIITLDNQKYAIDELTRHIQLWLWKVYHQCPLINIKRKKETKPDTYERIFKSLRESEVSNRLSVITTNYDLVFEYLSWKNGMPCYYPLEKSESINIGGGTKPFVYLNSQDNKEGRRPVLCKLHGSINYFQDHSNDSKLHVANLLGGDEPIGKSGSVFWKDKPAIFAVDAIWCIMNKYGHNVMPAIIPPTYAKLTQQHWLRNIWNTAFNLLRNARKIIFIGYSMPDSDGFMRALIHSAMAYRASQNVVPPQVFVIDSSQETHQRYQQLFHEIYKPLQPLPLSEATKSVIPKILSKTDC
ncbi:SIR2 family protein [bacterium]|nr:SIR2 family protein [bacterium]